MSDFILDGRECIVLWCLTVILLYTYFIFIAPAYSRVRYRSPNFCLIAHAFIHLLTIQFSFLCTCDSCVKPCIALVRDMPFKHTPRPGALDMYFKAH